MRAQTGMLARRADRLGAAAGACHNPPMRRLLSGVVVAAVAVAPACTVGPDYTQPAIVTPHEWHQAHVAGIVEARAIRGIAVGDRYPQVDLSAEASTTEPSENAIGLPAELLRQRPDVRRAYTIVPPKDS